MSLYANYIKERQGDETVEVDEGFATYRFPDAETVYLVDLYVLPDYRAKGLARLMGDRVAAIARKRGCKYMIGSVSLAARGAGSGMRVLLAYGMEPVSCGDGAVFFRKEIS